MHSIGRHSEVLVRGLGKPTMLNTIDTGENPLHIVIHLLQFGFLTQYIGLRMFQ